MHQLTKIPKMERKGNLSISLQASYVGIYRSLCLISPVQPKGVFEMVLSHSDETRMGGSVWCKSGDHVVAGHSTLPMVRAVTLAVTIL